MDRDHLDLEDEDSQSVAAQRPPSSQISVRSIYCPTVEATVEASFAVDATASLDAQTLLEVPGEQYSEAADLITQSADSPDTGPTLLTPAGTYRIRRGTVSYQQALRIAQARRIDGVEIDPDTSMVNCDFPYGMSFALEYARARWSGGSERAAVAVALSASLKAGPSSSMNGLLSARLSAGRGSLSRSARTDGAISGVASSPLGRGAADGALRSLSTMAGPVGSGHLGLLAGASPVASTVAMGVANLDFYRAALERSISWKQFTKNMAIKASGIFVGAGGWASGSALGSVLGGPVGALVGGLVGALSGGSLGAVGAKRVADRFIEDDAIRLMAIVQQRSEELAFEYMLTAEEIDEFAKRIKTLINPAWLRRMFRIAQAANSSESGAAIRAARCFADRELGRVCSELVELRPRIAPPSAESVNLVLVEIGLLGPADTRGP
jgi:hypothetical protein